MIDFFEWDRRALPVPQVHVDTGPLTQEQLGDWVLRVTGPRPGGMLDIHSSWPRLREAAYAFAATLPRGSLLICTPN